MKHKSIDLFAGIGGIRLGFERAFKNSLLSLIRLFLEQRVIKSREECITDKMRWSRSSFANVWKSEIWFNNAMFSTSSLGNKISFDFAISTISFMMSVRCTSNKLTAFEFFFILRVKTRIKIKQTSPKRRYKIARAAKTLSTIIIIFSAILFFFPLPANIIATISKR